MELHHLTSAQFRSLAGSFGDTAAMHELTASRASYHLLLLRFVADHRRGSRVEWDAAVDLLATVQTEAPQIYFELLSDPMIGAWLARTVRRVKREPHDEATLRGEFRQLGCVAAAAAIRAGLTGEVVGSVRNGVLTLPTLGTAQLGGPSDRPIPIRITAGEATLLPEGATNPVRVSESAHWFPLRQLRAEHEGVAYALRLEDGDPHRGAYHAPAGERLTPAEADRWQESFTEAWRLMVRHLPARATEVAIGLRAVVPLVDLGDGAARSGTARESVGALGMTAPRSPAEFVVTLVHEFQHSKLSALLDLVPLYRPDGTERHQVPWREDPRPTSGLIQGVYAFLGVADAWRRLRSEPALATIADREFATHRDQVAAGFAALERSAELTPAGSEFVEAMFPTLAALLDEPLLGDAAPEGSTLLERRTTR